MLPMALPAGCSPLHFSPRAHSGRRYVRIARHHPEATPKGQRLAQWLVVLACWWMGVPESRGWSQSSSPSPPAAWQDDASLHAVCLAGDTGAFAVGDHGAIWASTDGGRTWRLQRSGVAAPLYDVFFLSRREGWAVGGETEPYTLRPRGVVLHTRDAGATWEVLQPAATSPEALADTATESETTRLDSGRTKPRPETGAGHALPRLRRVRFFTPLLGLAAGAAPQSGLGGLFRTTDGGHTWEPLPSDNPTEWLAADFPNLETGALAGLRGETTRFREGTLEPGRNPPLGLRGVYDLSLADGRGGWLAGDGGLLLATTNGGLVWQAPEANLPDGVAALFDFRAVASRGPKVWVAGTPGSVIWHSADFGENWTAQPTGQALPLTGLAMDESGRGCAVGALGVILQTSDGGERWEVVRGERRRAALWQLLGRASDTRLAVPVDYAGEQGFRTVLEALAREDLPQATRSAADWPLRFAEAVPRAGGAVGETAWQFPLAVPGLERDPEALWAEWNRRNENKLEEVLTGHLVRQLRTWRPSVVVLERPRDALTRLLRERLLVAVEQAADPTRWLVQQELAQLEPWTVDRVYEELPAGSTGAVQLDRHAALPLWGLSATAATRLAEGSLRSEPAPAPARVAWQIIHSRAGLDPNPPRAGFFAGLQIPPGSPARRNTREAGADAEALARQVRRQRNFEAVSERAVAQPAQAARLVANLPALVEGLPDAVGADVLGGVVQRYRETGQWDLAELTLVELARRYPEEPAGWHASRTLVQWWSSSELAWRRLARDGTRSGQLVGNPEATREALTAALDEWQRQSRRASATLFDENLDVAVDPASGQPTESPPGDRTAANTPAGGDGRAAGGAASGGRPGGVTLAGGALEQDFEGQLRYWQGQAVRVARQLERRAPAVHDEPAVLLPLAAAFRRQGFDDRAQAMLARGATALGTGPWALPSQAESWLATRQAPPEFPLVRAAGTSEPPLLDGVLSDKCWQRADELRLRFPPEAARLPGGGPALVFLCHDDEYLYWAGSLPKRPGGPVANDAPPRRRHDATSDAADQVSLLLDLDRDLHTGYRLVIDHQGQTGDLCLEDPTWNPKWFVAVSSDKTHWRFEAAIPWRELAAVAPAPGTAWLVGLVRSVPAVGLESLSFPATPLPRPESYGLLVVE